MSKKIIKPVVLSGLFALSGCRGDPTVNVNDAPEPETAQTVVATPTPPAPQEKISLSILRPPVSRPIFKISATGYNSGDNRNFLGWEISKLAKEKNVQIWFRTPKDYGSQGNSVCLECPKDFLLLVKKLPHCGSIDDEETETSLRETTMRSEAEAYNFSFRPFSKERFPSTAP